MKKIIVFTILFFFVFSLSSCDTPENDDLAHENEVKVIELETELSLLKTQIEEYITANDVVVEELETQAQQDEGHIDNLELQVQELQALLAGDGGTVYLDINGRLAALENLEDNDTIYDDQWIVDFVNAYNEYDDSEIQYFMGDFNLYYHINPEIPEYYFYACPKSGTDTVINYSGVIQTCSYSLGELSHESIEVFYESGQLKYELKNSYNSLTTDMMIERLTYYFENGGFYYTSTNEYDENGGFFTSGGYLYYDFFGYSTIGTSRGLEVDLWDEFITFLTTQ